MARKKVGKVAKGGGISEGIAQNLTFVGNVFDEPNRDFSKYLTPAGRIAMERKIEEILEARKK